MFVALELPHRVAERASKWLCRRSPHGQRKVAPSTRRLTVTWIAKLRSQTPPSQMSLVLTVCVIALSIMSIALIWQAQIIANQRDAIRWLENAKVGS